MASPPAPLTIADLLDRQAAVRARAVAISSRHRAPLTYGELHGLVRRIAADLTSLGCVRDDRIGVVMANGPEMATACLATACAATCVPLNPAYTEAELEALMRRLRVGFLLVDCGQDAARSAAGSLGVPAVEIVNGRNRAAGHFDLACDTTATGALGASGAASAGDIALVLHTSGSTAEPKIVPLTHRNLVASAANVARSLGLGADDVCLSALPLFHIGALVDLLLAPLTVGGRVVFADGMDADEILAHLEETRPTWYQAVPTMLQDVLHRAATDGVDLSDSGLRFIRSVSAPLAPAVLAEVEERFGIPVIEIYGMTETSGVITSNPMPPGERRPGSVGLPAGPQVAVLDPAGNAAAPGERGEVVVRGDTVTAGYESQEGKGGDAFLNGWLRTGDEGYLDEDGYLYLTGRIKEIINRGGEKISPREIDEVALEHPDLLEAATFATRHDTLGEEVAMAVVPAPGRTPDVTELRTFLSERLARFKVPKAIHVCDALPRAPGGKLQRARLLEWCRDPGDLDGPSDVDGPVPPETERQRLLVDAWQQCLDVRPIGVTDDFVDLGGDSLRAVELAMDMSERLGVEIPAAALYDNPTIAELDAVVDSFEVGPAGKTGRAGRAPARVGEAAMLAEVAELVATWEGRRLSSDSLLVGRNTMGGRPPLFWGVQGFGELREVAERLGPEQPVWGMRSLYETRSKSPENAVALARAYRVEIERIQPEGAVHLGGYCAGAGIAFEIARQLRAAGRDVTSLSLFEHFQPEGYDGRLAYFFAAESGWHPFRTRDEPWLQHGSGPVSLHPSRKVHVDILSDDGVIAALALELEAAEAAAGVKETGMGRVDPQPRIEVEAMPPRTLVSRARRSMEVRITNHGTAAWPAGTMLYSRWGRPGSGTVFFDGVATLGRVTTGETATMPIEIAAPLAPGPWRLSLQLVHAGDWRSGPVLTVFRAPVLVLPGTAVLAYLRRKLTGSSDWSLAIRRLIGRTT